MTLLFIQCVVHCCTRVMTKPNWVDDDYKALRVAQTNCKELAATDKIYKGSSCLVEFLKVEDRMFRATCGKDNN